MFRASLIIFMLFPIVSLAQTRVTSIIDGDVSRIISVRVQVADEGGGYETASAVIATCENNRTRVELQFLQSYPADGATMAVLPDGTSRLLSLGGPAARRIEIEEPIRFLREWVTARSVILESTGGGLAGRARFSLPDIDLNGIYQLAELCEWSHQLPAIDTLPNWPGPLQPGELRAAG